MALSPRISNQAASTGTDAILNLLDSGYLCIYSGTQPATVDTAPTTAEVLLAQLTFASTAFAAASSGIASANTITDDTSADATGTAAWFRTYGNTTTVVVFDGSVGATTSENLVLNSVAISSGASVSVTSFTFTLPRSS